MTGFDWRTAAPADVDHEYSPSRHAKRPLEDYLADYRRAGEGLDPELLTIPGAPLLVYIHGGYWQQLSAVDSLFNAPDAQRLGVSLHAVDYTIAPAATIEEMVQECVVDVVEVIDACGAPRVVLAGCSAGAHLAAMSARDPRLAGKLNGVVLLSGIYDVRPLVVTPTNDALGLDDARAARLSPMLLPAPSPGAAFLCAVGDHESGEFIRQNTEYATTLERAGCRVVSMVVADRDHFDLPYDLLSAGTPVGDWVLSILEVR